MRLLVLTPTLGHSPYFSAMAQSLAGIQADVRHVLVCPASSASNVAAQVPEVEIVPQTGSGLYAALNEGLAAAGGDWDAFTWINDDDVLVPNGIAAALKLFADPAIGAVYGRVSLIDGAGRCLGALPVAHRPADLIPLIAAGLMPLAQPGTIFRRSAVAHVGSFDVSFRLAGDLDYFARTLRGGVSFAFTNTEIAQFRLHEGQLSKDEAAAAAEHARVVDAMPRMPTLAARWRFRFANLPVYLERIRRHGFVSMRSLYRHG